MAVPVKHVLPGWLQADEAEAVVELAQLTNNGRHSSAAQQDRQRERCVMGSEAFEVDAEEPCQFSTVLFELSKGKWFTDPGQRHVATTLDSQ